MIQSNGPVASIKGDNEMILIELATLIRCIRKSIESESDRADAFEKIKECGELAFVDDDIEFTRRITERLTRSSK